MSAHVHDEGALATYVFGALPEDERRALEDHLDGCVMCRQELSELKATAAALDDVPPEMFLDGPPDDDLMLQRALRRVRAERARRVLGRRTVTAAVAAAAVLAAAGGGVALERNRVRDSLIVSPPPVATATAGQPSGTRTGSGTDPTTGAQMTVTLIPAAGWVRVNAAVAGIPAGQRCRLWVVARDGSRQLAGSWLVSEKGAQDGTALDGSALVAPADAAAVQVDNFDGDPFVTVAL